MFIMQRNGYLLLMLYMFHTSSEKSTSESLNYVAAVVEYSPDVHGIVGVQSDILSQNAEQYVKLIASAADQSADIIVFPECGLATLGSSTNDSSLLPDPEDKVNPCMDASSGVHDAIRTLSCAARNYSIYVVVNIPEKSSCDQQPSSDCVLYYNSDVVFNREGIVVARYRKFNLFGEPGFNITKEAEMSVFNTDFDVKFGLFTCFDIMFEKPAISLVKDKGIKNIIFPTAWFSELPFLTAVQEQASWSYGMEVNLLGSGYNRPSMGSTGSGIYSGKLGSIKSIMLSDASTQLLVAKVPKIPSNDVSLLSQQSPKYAKSKSGIKFMKDYLNPYTTYLLSDTNTETNKTICNNGLCCDFHIKWHLTSSSEYKYRLVVFDGVRSFTYKTGGIQVCAIVFCADHNLRTCGVEVEGYESKSTVFDHITIYGEFRYNHAAQFPNTLLNNYSYMAPQNFRFERTENVFDNSVQVLMEMKNSQSSLLTFGIYGRDFLKDGQPVTEEEGKFLSSAGNTLPSTTLNYITAVIFTSMALTLYYYMKYEYLNNKKHM